MALTDPDFFSAITMRSGGLRAYRGFRFTENLLELNPHFTIRQDPDFGKSCADNYQVASIPRLNQQSRKHPAHRVP